MRFEAHLPRHEAAASVSKPAPLKSLKKRSYKKLRKSKGLLSAGEAEELLRQRCRGIWSDSDEDLASRTILAPEVSQTGDAHVNTSKSAGDTNTFSKCPLIKHGGKGRKSMSDGPHNEAPEKSDEPAARSTSRSCHNSPQAQHHGGFETGAQGNTEEHYWERQRLQTRNTGGAPQSSSCTSKSLQRLKELGGFATLCPSKKEIGKGESRGRKITDKESAQQAKDAQKVFDETVQKIRNMGARLYHATTTHYFSTILHQLDLCWLYFWYLLWLSCHSQCILIWAASSGVNS